MRSLSLGVTAPGSSSADSHSRSSAGMRAEMVCICAVMPTSALERLQLYACECSHDDASAFSLQPAVSDIAKPGGEGNDGSGPRFSEERHDRIAATATARRK